MQINVALVEGTSAAEQPLEIVERKGIGHPDTICDALAETFSSHLARFYLDRFGAILHHNVDKALLCGGAARATFGGGELTAPIEIHLAGRATCEFDGITVPVNDIAIESARGWLHTNLPTLDCNRDVRIVPHVRSTSPDLVNLFQRANNPGAILANDTSFGVGFAPFDVLEKVVLAVECALRSRTTRRMHPEIGADTKVMGSRHEDAIELTVACAFVSQHIVSLADYAEKKKRVQDLALQAARAVTSMPITVRVNAADRDTPDSIYLTVTGLSAESGDDGQVGRGNRVSGLITPYRPMSLEAAAGKNPVTHVGKLYNVMAHRVAHALSNQVPEVAEAYCYLLSRIGRPIAEPPLFDVKVKLKDSIPLGAVSPRIHAIACETFAGLDSIRREAVDGMLQLW